MMAHSQIDLGDARPLFLSFSFFPPAKKISKMSDAESSIEVARTILNSGSMEVESEELDSPPTKRRSSESSTGDALEKAISEIEAHGKASGFDEAGVASVVALACEAAVSDLASTQAMCARLFAAAIPRATVSQDTVVSLVGAANGMPSRSRLACLEWLLAVWPALSPAAIRSLSRCYFAFFHWLQYDSLLEASACVVCRLTGARQVTPFRIRTLTRLFERSGALWPAALLCLYHRLCPDMFVLPFDDRKVIGSRERVDKMLAVANLPAKRHVQWRESVAEMLSSHGSAVPSWGGAGPVHRAQPPSQAPDPLPGFPETVVPRATYSYSVGGGPEIGSLSSVGEIVRFAGAKENTAVPKLPDHLASVILSRPSLQFVGVALFGNGRQLERIQDWAAHVLTSFCLRGHPHSLVAVEALSKVADVLREIPPAAEAALPHLLGASNPLRHAALRLFQWLPPVTFAGREAEAVNRFLGSVIEGDERDSHYALCAIARLVARLSSGVRDDEQVQNTGVCFRQVRPSPWKDTAHTIQAIAAVAWETATGFLSSDSRTPMMEDAVLCLLESVSACDVDVAFPDALLRTLVLEAKNCMALSRALGIAVSFSRQRRQGEPKDPIHEKVSKICPFPILWATLMHSPLPVRQRDLFRPFIKGRSTVIGFTPSTARTLRPVHHPRVRTRFCFLEVKGLGHGDGSRGPQIPQEASRQFPRSKRFIGSQTFR